MKTTGGMVLKCLLSKMLHNLHITTSIAAASFAVAVVLLSVLFSSCVTKTKVEYRDRDVNHYITNTVHDTLVDKTTDSVYFEKIVSGDTVFLTKYKERTRWRDRTVERHDTCWRDSVVTEYRETVREVKKIPTLFKAAMLFSVICLIIAIIKTIRWVQIH